MGTAHDVLVAGRPPRSVFLDFPLGNTAGRPFLFQEQYNITRAALEALENIRQPGQPITLGHKWSEDESWKITAKSDDRGDQRQPRDLIPRYQFEDDRIAAEE